MDIKFSRGTATLDSATMPPEMLKVLDARKPDDIYFIRSRGGASFFKVTSVDQKPLTTDQANEFAKRQVRVEIGRKGAEAISKSALADAKFEGDLCAHHDGRQPPPPAATPGARNGRRGAPGATPAPAAVESAGAGDRTPAREPKGAAEELIGCDLRRRVSTHRRPKTG